MNLAFSDIEATERLDTEVDIPDSIVDFLELDLLDPEYLADEDAVLVPTQGALVADSSDFEVSRVLDIGDSSWIPP